MRHGGVRVLGAQVGVVEQTMEDEVRQTERVDSRLPADDLAVDNLTDRKWKQL